MGTMVAPTYACLFMAWLETQKILKLWTGTKPIMYKHFIDDIFFIWPGSHLELKSFLKHMNQQHSHIKFTATIDVLTNTIPFLDMLVTVKDGKITTDLCTKPTSVVQYLLPSSCHPGHICRNIPYSLGYRLLRICSNRATFLEKLQQLRNDLISRSYIPIIVDQAFKRVLAIPRDEALKKVHKTGTNRQVFALTYHPSLPSILGHPVSSQKSVCQV